MALVANLSPNRQAGNPRKSARFRDALAHHLASRAPEIESLLDGERREQSVISAASASSTAVPRLSGGAVAFSVRQRSGSPEELEIVEIPNPYRDARQLEHEA